MGAVPDYNQWASIRMMLLRGHVVVVLVLAPTPSADPTNCDSLYELP